MACGVCSYMPPYCDFTCRIASKLLKCRLLSVPSSSIRSPLSMTINDHADGQTPFSSGGVRLGRNFVGFPGAHRRMPERGTYLAVATGKGRRGLDRALVEHGFDAVFHASRCADETFSKPHPQMLLDIMDRLGVDAQDVLMVGDTEYDIVMAHNAGAAAVGETYGVHDRDRLLALRPFACAESKAELTRWIDACEWPLFEGIF